MGSTIQKATVASRRLPALVAGVAVSAIALMGVVAPTASASSLPASPLDQLGRPTAETTAQVRGFANQPWMPEGISNAILSALAFYSGAGNNDEGGVPIPENAPNITQFLWPTVSGSCIGGELDAVGSAIAVPGPVDIPAPGAGVGQTAFVFTALGTAPATADQGGMHVRWFNLNNMRHGTTPLDNNGINPDGPATLSGTADTGHGTVVAIVSGDVHTETATCSFVPTAAIIEAR